MKLNGRCACGMARPIRCVCQGQAPPRDGYDTTQLAIDRRNARRRQRHAERRARRRSAEA